MDVKTVLSNNIGKIVSIEVNGGKPINSFSPKIRQYSGTVLQSSHSDPANSFRLSTGLNDFPVRIISIERVVKINDKIFSTPTSTKRTNTFRIASSSGNGDYIVTLDDFAGNKCTCKGFSFRKSCNHLKGVLEQNR